MTVEEIDKIIEQLDNDLVYFRNIEFNVLYSKLDKYRRALCIMRDIVFQDSPENNVSE